jgi:hypothetical protein
LVADVTIPPTELTGTARDLDVANVDKFTSPKDIFEIPDPDPDPIGAYNNEAFA